MIVKIRKRWTKEPTGLWMPPPFDCKRMIYGRCLSDGDEIGQTAACFHDPLICDGQCEHGWKYGYVNYM